MSRATHLRSALCSSASLCPLSSLPSRRANRSPGPSDPSASVTVMQTRQFGAHHSIVLRVCDCVSRAKRSLEICPCWPRGAPRAKMIIEL